MKPTVKKILDNLTEYKDLRIQESRKSLKKILGDFEIRLVDYRIQSEFLSRVHLKYVGEPINRYLARQYPHLTGKTFTLGGLLEMSQFGDLVPPDHHGFKIWADDLMYALRTWMVEYGCEMQVLVGDRKSYPGMERTVSLVKRKLGKYGRKSKYLIYMGVGLFGALFWKLMFSMLSDDNLPFEFAEENLERFKRTASSQASWSILTSGVSQARVEAHIIRLTVNQLLKSLEKSPLKEELYRRVGDNLEALPTHLSKMERSLDRTNYALVTMGGDWYRQRLTHEDREMVDMAAKFTPVPIPSTLKESGSHMKQANMLKDMIHKIFSDTSLAEIAERFRKIPESQKSKAQKSLEEKVQQDIQKISDAAKESLEEKLRGFNLRVKKFDAKATLETNIIIFKEGGDDGDEEFTLRGLVAWAEKAVRIERTKQHPDPFAKDLLFTIKDWYFYYGDDLKKLTGEVKVKPDKFFFESWIRNVWQFFKISEKRARLIVQAIFKSIDPSALGLLAVIYSFKDMVDGIHPYLYVTLLVSWAISFLVVGWDNSAPHWRRLKRIV